MGKFFSAWATWEKLVFLLGCAIVITVLVGCGKLAHTHHKLRKYSTIADKEKQEQVVARQMTRHETDAPLFGIRAIESGIEVEGVWISRNNTPEPPVSRDVAKSSVWDHIPRKDYSIDLEMQQTTLGHDTSASNSIVAHAHLPDSHNRKASEVSSCSNPHASRGTSDIATIIRPVSAKVKDYPPSSISKYTGNPALHQLTGISPMDGLDAIHRASGVCHVTRDAQTGDSFERGTSAQSTDDSTDSEPIAASAPRLLNHAARQRQHSTDLDLMHNHRMSQAAETGQLTPRIRKPGFGGEWASIANTPNQNASETSDYFGKARARSLSPERGYSAASSFPSSGTHTMPLKIDTLPLAVRRSSLPGPNVASFTEFCQTAPASPMLDGYRPRSAGSFTSTKSAMQVVGDSLSEYTSAPSSPVKSAAPAVQKTESKLKQAGKTTPEPTEPRRSSFEKKASAVVRGHGTGFEILRPGTFRVPTGPAEHVPEKLHKQRPHAPPISLHNSTRTANTSRPRSSSGGSGRKLQKKRRPSSESETSSEGRSGSRSSMV